eukprot:g515.t1
MSGTDEKLDPSTINTSMPAAKPTVGNAMNERTIDKYSFCDNVEKQTVSVYVPLEGLSEIDKEAITIKNSRRRVQLRVRGLGGFDHYLRLTLEKDVSVLRNGISKAHMPLYPTQIAGAKFKKKDTKIVITIKKKNGELKWFDFIDPSYGGNPDVSDDDLFEKEDDDDAPAAAASGAAAPDDAAAAPAPDAA